MLCMIFEHPDRLVSIAALILSVSVSGLWLVKSKKGRNMFLKKFLLFGLMAAVLPAVAEEAADRKTATSLKYVEHELDTRQDKFTAEQNKAMEYTDSAGDVQKRTVKSDLGSDTSDTSLPMVGGVNTKLATKQDDIAAINDHTAVTYTGQSGSIGQKGIYQATESYANQSDNLIDAKTFNAALKRGLDSEFKCRDYKPDTNLCWVYSIHNDIGGMLPDGYTELEYIQSDGSQYIDTEVKLNQDSRVEIGWRYYQTSDLATSGRLFGARYISTPRNAFVIGTNNGYADPSTAMFFQFGGSDVLYGPNVSIGTWLDVVFDKDIHTINGTQYGEPFAADSFETPYTLKLFAFGQSAPGASETVGPSVGQCRHFRIYNNGALVRNMIPAQYGTTVGMYDTVEGRFFTSVPANTNFTAGPPASTNVYVPQNQ